MSVTVVSCVYGDHASFVAGWLEAVNRLDPAPDRIIVASDRALGLPAHVGSVIGETVFRHPQAQYLNMAVGAADTEWVWVVDIDDRPMADALKGLEAVTGDVWMTGFVRYDGEHYDEYVPPKLTPQQVLAASTSVIPGGSAIRREAFRDAGGYPDVAFQDWALWRRLARHGASFVPSGRTHYCYNRHADTRSATELTPDRRQAHVAELMEQECEDMGLPPEAAAIFTGRVHES